MPSWSPDGTWTVVDRKNPPGIALIPVDGGKVKQLTGEALHNAPAWSPRGDQIAYVDKAAGGLWVLENPLGDPKPREILQGPIEIYDGCWSPRGTWIAFLRVQNLGIVNVATGEYRVLVEGEDLKGVVLPRWSPDEKMIAGIRYPEVVLVDVQSGETRSVGVQGQMVAWGAGGALWVKAARAPHLLLRRAADGTVDEINLGGRIQSLDADTASGRAVVGVDGRGIAVVTATGKDIFWVTDDGSDKPASLAPGGCQVTFIRPVKGPRGGELFVLDRRSLTDGGLPCD